MVLSSPFIAETDSASVSETFLGKKMYGNNACCTHAGHHDKKLKKHAYHSRFDAAESRIQYNDSADDKGCHSNIESQYDGEQQGRRIDVIPAASPRIRGR